MEDKSRPARTRELKFRDNAVVIFLEKVASRADA